MEKSVAFLITLLLFVLTPTLHAEPKSYRMGKSFCEVEIRAGNSPNALDNEVIHSVGKVQKDEVFTTEQTFIFAQREANPEVCGSGRGVWNRCGWDECQLD